MVLIHGPEHTGEATPAVVGRCFWPHTEHIPFWRKAVLGGWVWCSENEGSGWRQGGPSEPPQTRMQTLTPHLARAGPFGPWPKIPPWSCLFLATEWECSGHGEMARGRHTKLNFFQPPERDLCQA